jgi:P-type Cu2+ transporter
MNDEHRHGHGDGDAHSGTDEVPAKPGHPEHPEEAEASVAAEHDHREHHAENGHDHGDHDKHAGHSVEMFRSRFWLSLALTLPVVFWSEHVRDAPRVRGGRLPRLGRGSGRSSAPIIFFYGGLGLPPGRVRAS